MLNILFLAVAVANAVKINPADRLGPRAPYAGGGWALLISENQDCPAGATGYNAGTDFGAGADLCCPNGFEQQGTGGIDGITCCAKDTSCLDALQLEPFCADSTWVLWNSTTETAGNGYFCCLPGEVGTQDMSCDSGSLDIPASITAERLGQPVPTGAAGVTLSVTISESASNTETSASAKTASASATTTEGSAGGIISSVLSKATSKSDSSKIMPPGGSDIFRSITLFAGYGIVGFGGVIAIIFGAF